MHPIFWDLAHEEAWVGLLNTQLGVIKKVRIGAGGLTSATTDIRLILREAIKSNATHIFFCHNHPAGTCRPSRQDDDMTSNIKSACNTIGIKFIDHIIVTDNNYYSYADEGRI